MKISFIATATNKQKMADTQQQQQPWLMQQ